MEKNQKIIAHDKQFSKIFEKFKQYQTKNASDFFKISSLKKNGNKSNLLLMTNNFPKSFQ